MNMKEMEQYIIELAKQAKEAAPVMALQTTGKKNTALQTMANALRAQKKRFWRRMQRIWRRDEAKA